jgi:ubiquinone/menaquinone biosynthesis C-methylase UbiE
MLPETAGALCEHPAVRDAAAYPLPGRSDTVEASIVANESYLDDVMGREEAASRQVSTWRKTYDLSQLAKAAAASPFAFNVAGWNSSYTRRPLPPEDMREWVQTTVDRISTLAPTDVLEIGCGTGLLLLRLASSCKRYVAVDFAPSVLRRLREQLAQAEDFCKNVELLERSADNFEGFADNSFSTVIVNSVAQYFPSQAYLNRVVQNAIRVVQPGGHVFFGDLRNFMLLEACATSIEAFQAPPELSVSELHSRVHKRLQQEQELVLSPAYFLSLQHRLPKVVRVEIYPRRGNRDNELTRFRFDAILWIGPQTAAASPIPFLDLPANRWGVNEIKSLLATRKEEALGFMRIPNSRVERDMRLMTRLANADPKQTFGELRQEADQAEVQGIHPEEIVRVAADTGYQVAISWAGCHSDGGYDAAFIRQSSPEHCVFPAVKWPQPMPAAFVYCTNAPGQAEIRQKLADELLSHCRARLQGKSVPASLHLVDSFPRTSDGSVDCDALLSATGPNYAR